MEPTITVITPVFNAVATIERALDSVSEQRVAGVEHVVVDGGSTDGTLALLQARPGLRWISESDRGLSDAMNKGLALATGDVIGWLNADDFYLPGALAAATAGLGRAPNAEWLTAPCIIVDAEDREIRTAITAYKRFWLRRYSLRTLLMQNYIAAPATFVRAAALREVGGFDERFRYSMDYDLWLRLARRGAPVVLHEPLTAFRMAEGSLSMTGFERQFREHALNAREHGAGHPLAVAANQLTSRAIIAAYRLMQRARATS